MMNNLLKSFGTIIGTMSVCAVIAQPLDQTNSYVPETSKLINQASIQATNAIRTAQKTENLKIPKDWRLVSVAPYSKSGTTDQEFILFFQDSNSNVHSLGITVGGMVTGRNILRIQATE